MMKSKKLNRLIIATDSPEIRNIMNEFGADVAMTSKKHQTGSDRVAEVSRKIKSDIVINIQGDSFGLKASTIDNVISKFLKSKSTKFATLAYKISSDNDLFDPNIVKLVKNYKDEALWFSRFPMPYLNQADRGFKYRQFNFYGHLGVYLYTWNAIQKFSVWKRSLNEKAESLEQLRILENDEKIRVFTTRSKSISIDTKDDLKKIDSIL